VSHVTLSLSATMNRVDPIVTCRSDGPSCTTAASAVVAGCWVVAIEYSAENVADGEAAKRSITASAAASPVSCGPSDNTGRSPVKQPASATAATAVTAAQRKASGVVMGASA
jgi:hypothetical protein